MYPSDGLGCDYGNNWNSVHYGKKKVTDVRVQVGMALSGDPQIRSSLDSYLMASAYTRSCSNDNYLDANCFGLTHPEEKRWCILWILISCGLIGVELLLYLIYFVIGKIKYRRAVNASNPEATDDLLNATVYACLFEEDRFPLVFCHSLQKAVCIRLMSSSLSYGAIRKGSRGNSLIMSESSRDSLSLERASNHSAYGTFSLIPGTSIRSEGSMLGGGRKLDYQPVGKTSIPWLNSMDSSEVVGGELCSCVAKRGSGGDKRGGADAHLRGQHQSQEAR